MSIRIIDANHVSGIRSQTIYHGLAQLFNENSKNTIVITRPLDSYFSIGYFQDAEFELDIDYCKRKRIPIVRRETGGGAVYLDHNQIFIQWIFHKDDLPINHIEKYKYFIQPIVNTYKEFGIEAYYKPINDVHVNKRKIVGIGGAQINHAQVITGNFILDFDFDTMLEALNIQDHSFRIKSQRDMNSYLTSFKKELGFVPDYDEIKQTYIEKCYKLFDSEIQEDCFSRDEINRFEILDKKMLTTEWLLKVKRKSKSEKMLKIHSDVWIGSLDYDLYSLEFQLKFGKLTSLELKEHGKQYQIEEFEEMVLGLNEILKRVAKVFKQTDLLYQKNKRFWIDHLEEIIKMRSRYS